VFSLSLAQPFCLRSFGSCDKNATVLSSSKVLIVRETMRWLERKKACSRLQLDGCADLKTDRCGWAAVAVCMNKQPTQMLFFYMGDKE
jgi:hypothetical protein